MGSSMVSVHDWFGVRTGFDSGPILAQDWFWFRTDFGSGLFWWSGLVSVQDWTCVKFSIASRATGELLSQSFPEKCEQQCSTV